MTSVPAIRILKSSSEEENKYVSLCGSNDIQLSRNLSLRNFDDYEFVAASPGEESPRRNHTELLISRLQPLSFSAVNLAKQAISITSVRENSSWKLA